MSLISAVENPGTLFSEYEKSVIPTKLWCGVLFITIETGRYVNEPRENLFCCLVLTGM